MAVEYTVHVPRRTLLKHINTVNGALRVKDLDSVGDLHTVNGNIEVYEKQRRPARAHHERKRLRGVEHPSNAHGTMAETTNGSVPLGHPGRLQADLEAK